MVVLLAGGGSSGGGSGGSNTPTSGLSITPKLLFVLMLLLTLSSAKAQAIKACGQHSTRLTMIMELL